MLQRRGTARQGREQWRTSKNVITKGRIRKRMTYRRMRRKSNEMKLAEEDMNEVEKRTRETDTTTLQNERNRRKRTMISI